MVALLAAGCVELYRPSGAPTGLAASTDEVDRIILTWNQVSFASAYSVYRSESENGDFAWIGSVSSSTYIDIDVGPEIDYWYAVAAMPYASPEAFTYVLSAAVLGTSLHDFAWSIASVDFDGEFVQLAADRTREGAAYAATSLSGESEIAIHRYDGVEWTEFDNTPGTASADTADSAPFTLASFSDSVLLAFADRANGDRLTVRTAGADPESEWTTLGAAGFGEAPSGRMETDVLNDAPIVVSEITTAPLVQAFIYDGTAWQSMGDLTTSLSGRTSAGISVARRSVTSILAIEDTTPTPSLVVVYEYSDGSGWTEITNLPRIGDDVLIGFSVAATESFVYLATLDASSGLIVSRFDGSSWTDLVYPFDADPSAEGVAIDAEGSRLILFSRDGTTLEGVISEYDEAWNVLPQSEDNEGVTSSLNLRQLRVDTFANRIFAGFVDGTAFGLSASVGIYR